ncbi:MAG: P-loop NTPase [Candidatus Aenigmarchaeota archaeon]|nr:P-loop NTPase [Candidatus Aenigmarchaeota archaeon]
MQDEEIYNSMRILEARLTKTKEKMQKIKHKIAVYSGKGGVGKTTVAANTAAALANLGFSVGFFDADIDCPNAHKLFGIDELARFEDNKTLKPVEKNNVKFISMALVQEGNNAIIWRGPMLAKAVNDLMFYSEWGDLDFLIIDMPPGTSDIPLTVMKSFDLSGFLLVTTPQQMAINDMVRSANMVSHMNFPVIGIIDNMCGDVFGCSDEKIAKELDTKFIGHIKLSKMLREKSDKGQLCPEEFKGIAKAIKNYYNI